MKRRGNTGWSTRTKFKSLPKYVYLFQHPKSNKTFRVCKKHKGKTVTIGYYHKLEKATQIAELLY